MQTLSIPRGQVAIAAARATADARQLLLTARRGDTGYGICSTAFLEYAFRTDSYRIEVVFEEKPRLWRKFRRRRRRGQLHSRSSVARQIRSELSRALRPPLPGCGSSS